MTTADEIRRIQIQWIGDISGLTSEIDASRQEIEEFKTIMRSMGAETEESLAVVESAFKRSFNVKILDPLKARITEMKAELKEFGDLPIGAQQLARDQGFLTGTEEDLAAEQQNLQRLVDGTKIAVSELRKEFIKNAESAQKGFEDAGVATDRFRDRVNQAKLELQTLVAEGKNLGDARAGLETTGRFEPKELAQANREVAASIKEQEKAYQDLEKSINSSAAAAKKSAEQVASANKDATLETDKWRISVNAAKVELKSLVASGRNLDDAFQGMKTAGKYTAPQLTQALKEVKVESGEVKKEFSALGNVAQRVFRSIVGFFVLGVLRQLITAMGELIEKAQEFNKAIINLSIAARAAQRSGLDVTFSELVELVEQLRSKFGIFTSQELRKGIDQLIIFGKETKLTKDQLLGLADAIAAAATVTGLDFETAVNRVMRALTTGQTRGLLEAGFAITELMVKEEAYAAGLAERGTALDDVAKQQAILNLIMEQSNRLNEDSTEIQETLTGKITSEKSALSDVKDEIGTKLLPAYLLLLRALNAVITVEIWWTDLIQNTAIGLMMQLAHVFIVLSVAVQTFTNLLKGELTTVKEFNDEIERLKSTTEGYLRDIAFPTEEGFGDALLGDAKDFLPPPDEVDEEGEKIKDALKDLFIKFRETIIDGKQDVAKENRGFFQDMFEKMQKFIFKMQQLAEKYAFDVQGIWTDYRDKLAEIDIKYREKEIKAEEDFQDKMRKLRNKFLMDLEDALQERDAKQILRLIRNFNAQANELRREKEKESKDRLREENDEKAALARRRDQRLRDLKLENDFRTKQAIDQYNLERKLAWEDHVNKLKEIDIRTQERLEKITRDFKDEHDITEEGAALVAEALNRYFGPSGQIEMIYEGLLTATDNFIARWSAKLRYMQGLGLNVGGFTDDSGNGPDPNQPKIDDIKKRIEDKDYGKSSSLNMGFTAPTSVLSLGLPTVSRPISQNQKVTVEIGLDKNLTGEIIEQTLGEVADVFIRVTR